MCGIAGIARATGPPPSPEALTRMARETESLELEELE